MVSISPIFFQSGIPQTVIYPSRSFLPIVDRLSPSPALIEAFEINITSTQSLFYAQGEHSGKMDHRAPSRFLYLHTRRFQPCPSCKPSQSLCEVILSREVPLNGNSMLGAYLLQRNCPGLRCGAIARFVAIYRVPTLGISVPRIQSGVGVLCIVGAAVEGFAQR